MREPVKLVQTGSSFECVALEQYMRNNPNETHCPVTKQLLADRSFVKDVALAREIDAYMQGDAAAQVKH